MRLRGQRTGGTISRLLGSDAEAEDGALLLPKRGQDRGAKTVQDKELSILKINTDVFNGDVALLGVVPSKHAEERLLAIARGVKGVKSVTSKLTIQQK